VKSRQQSLIKSNGDTTTVTNTNTTEKKNYGSADKMVLERCRGGRIALICIIQNIIGLLEHTSLLTIQNTRTVLDRMRLVNKNMPSDNPKSLSY